MAGDSRGPVIVDVSGPELLPEERELIGHPLVGGVILFSRNFESPDQVHKLALDIKSAGHAPVLVSVDQEGGRIQRFREGFEALPAAAAIGRLYDEDRAAGLRVAEAAGWIMASELLSVGVDFSFAPVLDVGTSASEVIGDRSFHDSAEAVTDLAGAYCAGMERAGMASIGKHFPGHGGVGEDSHVTLPVDPRSLAELERRDLAPYRALAPERLAGIMTAHVLYPEVDDHPPTFSSRWLREVLRQRLGFGGVIFSDDLSMAGAGWAGDAISRASLALAAGCDMILVCNDPQAAVSVVQQLPSRRPGDNGPCLERLYGQRPGKPPEKARWAEALRAIRGIVA